MPNTAQNNLLSGEKARSIDRRRGDRIAAKLEVLVKSPEADFVETRSADVSSGGMFVATQTPLRPGTLLRIRRDTDVLIDGVGRVVWTRSLEQSSVGEPPGMGIKFVKLAPKSKQALERLSADLELPLPAAALRVATEPVTTAALVEAAAPTPGQPAPQPATAREAGSGIRPVRRTLPPLAPSLIALRERLRAARPSAPIREAEPSQKAPSALLPPLRRNLLDPAGASPYRVLPPNYSSASERAVENTIFAVGDRPGLARDGADASEYVDASEFVQEESDAVARDTLTEARDTLAPAPFEPVPSATAARPAGRRRGVGASLAVATGLSLLAAGWGLSSHRTTPPKPAAARAQRLAEHRAPAEPAALPRTGGPAPAASAPLGVAPIPVGTAPAPQGAQHETHAASAAAEGAAPGAQGYLLHVESDPPGAWISVEGQRVFAPADIRLPDFQGKRLPLTLGRFGYADQLVYVPRDSFVEQDGTRRAEVQVKLKIAR